jgi:hypothetical protein
MNALGALGAETAFIAAFVLRRLPPMLAAVAPNTPSLDFGDKASRHLPAGLIADLCMEVKPNVIVTGHGD